MILLCRLHILGCRLGKEAPRCGCRHVLCTPYGLLALEFPDPVIITLITTFMHAMHTVCSTGATVSTEVIHKVKKIIFIQGDEIILITT